MDWSGYRWDVRMGFRVEVHDRGHPSENKTFRYGQGSMVPRDPLRPLDAGAFRDHLNWGSRHAGPPLSFTSKWERAMIRMQRFIEQGARDVVVLAVWLEGLEIYDAYGVAGRLQPAHQDRHLDEFLLRGAIDSESYRIMAAFDGNREQEDVTLTTISPRIICTATIPRGFTRCAQFSAFGQAPSRDATVNIRDELYSRTGTRDEVKLDSLLRRISGVA